MQCPSCHSVDIRRSRPQGGEKIRRWLLARKPFRCRACNFRWTVFDLQPRQDIVPVAVWSMAIFLAGAVLLALFELVS